MKTNLEVEGDTVNVKKKPSKFIIDDGKGKKIPGKKVKIGDSTHIHIYGEKKGTQKIKKKSNLSLKEIMEDETRRYYERKIKQEEKKIREKVSENIARIQAEKEALKRHKLLVLLRGSPEFRKEFWGDANFVHPTDPFKNNLDRINKLKGTKKWNEIVEKAKQAGKAWENGILLKKYEGTLQNLIKNHNKFADKMNYQALFEKVGKPFEEFCRITGLERFGFKLNPGEFIRLPYLREYKSNLAKMKYLALTKAIELHKDHEKNYRLSKNRLSEIQKKREAYFEQLRKRAGKK